jgi:hypothetical protein
VRIHGVFKEFEKELNSKCREYSSQKGKYMKTNMGLWIDHRKAVIVTVSGKEEEISVIESKTDKQLGRFDGLRSTTPYESQKVQADNRQDIKFADQLNIYYDEVISILRDAESILLFGPGEAKGELKKRLEDNHLDNLIQAVETVDQMTDGQIAAKVREYFK